MAVKYVFVTGGVVSGIGKGITAASLGRLLKARGLKVTMQKFDPYINMDPGTMSPYQHGEVFVTDDGSETDLDLGHYERFIDENLSAHCNKTTGKIYWSVITKERRGEFLGSTVQVIPHITNEIIDSVYQVGKVRQTDIVITEIGGTVGDIESLPFLEAIRQVAINVGRENCLFIHVTLVPYLEKSGEQKSKPTQHSVKDLLGLGIQPDIIVCRTTMHLPKELRDKIALFCNVPSECIIENMDTQSLYEVPLMLELEGLGNVVCKRLHLDCRPPDLSGWSAIVEKHKTLRGCVKIALVGKYVALHDAYISIAEALTHAGIAHGVNIEINWVNSDYVTTANIDEILSDCDGIIVPGGFGDRGIKGKILSIKYARENKIPFFGISLGMQLAVVEFARNVAKLDDAHSAELDPDTPHPVVDLVPGQKSEEGFCGAMRLGQYKCVLCEGTKAHQAYKQSEINERHRHRYEFNNKYVEKLSKSGLIIAGKSLDGEFIEVIEYNGNPWFVGVSFHPEFKSRPNRAHPLFKDFVKSTMENSKTR
ncbi:MAG: CTP synthase [Firmicutes bacterium]|nr:CTP synthase [Bacillota bacterium]